MTLTDLKIVDPDLPAILYTLETEDGKEICRFFGPPSDADERRQCATFFRESFGMALLLKKIRDEGLTETNKRQITKILDELPDINESD